MTNIPNNTKRGFGSAGLILVILIILGGGAYLWSQKKSVPAPTNNNVSTATSTIFSQADQTLVNLILNSNGFQDGERHANVPNPDGPLSETILKDRIAFGDLDNDGKDEAVAPYRYCAASCGLGASLFTFARNKVTMFSVPGIALSGAGKDMKNIRIEKGILSVTQTEGGKTWWTDQFKMVSGKLIKL